MILFVLGCGQQSGASGQAIEINSDPRFSHPTLAERWPHISLAETRRLMALSGTVLIDGRAFHEWQTSHIPGAISLPVGEFDKRYPMALASLRDAKILISYCHGENCRLSDTLAELLKEKGHPQVAVFWGGFPAWRDAGLALEDEKGRPVKSK